MKDELIREELGERLDDLQCENLFLIQNPAKFCFGIDAVLLANHGMLAVGKDLPSAFGLARGMEFCAEVQYRAMCAGKPFVLPDEEMERVIEKFKGYGQVKNR